MKRFFPNSLGGVDMYLDGGDTFIRLDADDLKAIFEVQQKQNDVDFVKHQVWSWVEKQLEDDDGFFADFNSHLFSGDEISKEEIVLKILSDDVLIQKITDEYRDILEDPATEEGFQEWWYAEEAIGMHTSIKDVMGQILCDKRPTELEVGRWRIFVIEQGDLYGTDSHKAPWKDEEPCVEFYDLLGRVGQQWTTGRFYVRDLVCPKQPTFALSLDEMVEQGENLVLNPNRKDWVVTPAELNAISAWLKAVYAQAQEKTQMKVTDVIANAQSRSECPAICGQERETVMK